MDTGMGKRNIRNQVRAMGGGGGGMARGVVGGGGAITGFIFCWSPIQPFPFKVHLGRLLMMTVIMAGFMYMFWPSKDDTTQMDFLAAKRADMFGDVSLLFGLKIAGIAFLTWMGLCYLYRIGKVAILLV